MNTGLSLSKDSFILYWYYLYQYYIGKLLQSLHKQFIFIGKRIMASPANKSASKNVVLDTSKDTNNSKLTSKEIREEYFNQLRSWLNTVNSYQCYYNKLQRESFQNNYRQVLKNTNEVPKVVPNAVPNVRETTTVNQFVGMYYSHSISDDKLFHSMLFI